MWYFHEFCLKRVPLCTGGCLDQRNHTALKQADHFGLPFRAYTQLTGRIVVLQSEPDLVLRRQFLLQSHCAHFVCKSRFTEVGNLDQDTHTHTHTQVRQMRFSDKSVSDVQGMIACTYVRTYPGMH